MGTSLPRRRAWATITWVQPNGLMIAWIVI